MNVHTFQYWTEKWLEGWKSSVKESTHYGYGLLAKKLILEFGERKIDEVTVKDIQNFLDELYQGGKAKSTINKHRYILQLIFRAAALGGEINDDPCHWTRTPKLAKCDTRRPLTEQEQAIILANRDAEPFGLYAFCLLLSGLRRSELLALCWEDIDLDNGMMHIDKVVTFVRSHPNLEYCLKNGWRDRFLPLPRLLLEELRKRKSKQTGLIFSSGVDLLHEGVVNRRWEEYREQVGLQDVTQHMVRHTYTTMLYDAGIDAKAAAALLGHSDERTTLTIYTHINKRRVAERAMDKLNVLIDSKL